MDIQTITSTKEKKLCHHCGQECDGSALIVDKKNFCCKGCLAVHELLKDTILDEAYRPSKKKEESNAKYDYLKNEEVLNSLLDFKSESRHKVSIKLPSIHCSSCIYVLENLNRIEASILKTVVDFTKKEASIDYDPQKTSLAKVASLLDSIGYPPQFEKKTKDTEKAKKGDRQLSIKIGIAAFCFGNIMLLSFPAYLGFDQASNETLKNLFLYLSIFLSLPIVFYSGMMFFNNAFKGLQKGIINIDLPIAVGIITLFLRSSYEVVFDTGIGYFDSLAGLVFFLLIGRWFQNKTYANLSFERDYKSYFPLAVLKKTGNQWVSTPIQNLKPGDEVTIRNNEIIPADAILLSDKTNINYSFVTGEGDPVQIESNQHVYAGGKLQGSKVHIRIIKESSQSYLTSLWNNQIFKKEQDSEISLLTNKLSQYFTPIVFLIATLSGVFWFFYDSSKVWEVFTAVLIVACPCALALSAPFTNGNTIRLLGRSKFYLKTAALAELIPKIDTIIFDKTGTITQPGESKISYTGLPLSPVEKNCIRQLTANSTHPRSKQIHDTMPTNGENINVSVFNEFPGKGIMGYCQGREIKLGSAAWLNILDDQDPQSSKVYVAFDGSVRGYFTSHNSYRKGMTSLISSLSKEFNIKFLSGDNSSERNNLNKLFGTSIEVHFNQSPEDKLTFVKSLQEKGQRIMMIGDGLNDAGALKQSNIGIAVTDDTSSFSPACDAIIKGNQLYRLERFIKYCKRANHIIIASFAISFLYNIIGLSFAITGLLTPIFAAILMPISSISVVLFTTLSGNYFSKKMNIVSCK